MLIPLIMLISMLRGLIVLIETISNVYLSGFYSDVSLMIATVVLVISIVLIVSIFALIYCVTDSEKVQNEYGTNPKANVIKSSIINWTDDKIHQSNFYVFE